MAAGTAQSLPAGPASFAHPAGPGTLLDAGERVTAYADWYFSGFLVRDGGALRAVLRVREVPDAGWAAAAAAQPGPPLRAVRLEAAGEAACARDDAGSDVRLFIPDPVPGTPDPGQDTAVRILRAMVLREFLDAGWGFLHAACVAVGGQGIGLAGLGHAGKTTALLQCLHWLGADAALVANDKLAVDPAGQAAAGFAVRAGIRPATLAVLPGGPVRRSLEERAAAQDGRMHARPQDLAAAAGASVTPLCPLRAVVGLALDPAASRPRLEEPSRRERRGLLEAWSLRGPADVYPQQAEAAPTRGPARPVAPDVPVRRLIIPPGDGRAVAALLAGLAG